MPPIVTLTLNPAVDKYCCAEQVVAERKLRCEQVHYHPGGGGLNVARAITELGGETTAYWARGGDVGERLRRLLDEEGIDHHPLHIRAMTRENLIVHERSSDRQYRFNMPGAELGDDELETCIEHLRTMEPPPDYLVLSGSLPPNVAEDVFARMARAMQPSSRVVVDTSGPAMKSTLQSPIYLMKPNMRELAELVGRPIDGDARIKEQARSLIDEGKVEVVVTSLGSGGAVLTTATEHQHIRAPTVKIRSKVGAGDSMVAGIVYTLSQGKGIVEATRFGVAAGSAAVMTEATELCRREETERLYREMP